jgi:hypothetical protein
MTIELIRVPSPRLAERTARAADPKWHCSISSEMRKYKYAYETPDGRWRIEYAYGECGGGWKVTDTTRSIHLRVLDKRVRQSRDQNADA